MSVCKESRLESHVFAVKIEMFGWSYVEGATDRNIVFKISAPYDGSLTYCAVKKCFSVSLSACKLESLMWPYAGIAQPA
jgi:hypothetical protein